VVVPLGAANATGRRKLEEGLKSLRPAGSTDMLEGAKLCLDQINAMEPAAKAKYQKTVLLITDGDQKEPG
jgi:Mg-chelatase subunit ChlD